MNLGADAIVVATNLAIAYGGIRVCLAWLPFLRRGGVRLWRHHLGMVPFSVVWLLAFLVLESVYYGAARIVLLHTGISMWSDPTWVAVVWVVRCCVLLGMIAHIIPAWRVDGATANEVTRNGAIFVGELSILWLLAYVFLR